MDEVNPTLGKWMPDLMLMFARTSGKHGLPLIEIVAVMFILAFALLASGQMQIMVSHRDAFASNMFIEVTELQHRIRQLRGLSLIEIADGVNTDISGIPNRVDGIERNTHSVGIKLATVTDSLNGIIVQLGQSWCKPEICRIKTGDETSDTVFLMAGGYDTNQDVETAAATDALGRAVFAVGVKDGRVSSFNFNEGNYSNMTHCIVDVSGFDSDEDGTVNRVYAGDLGGQIFAFEDDDGDGTWTKRRLFSASAVDGAQRKIFYAPDAVEESFGEIIFFGTGDRADPGKTHVVNRIYAIKNNWGGDSTNLTESAMVDVTDDLIQMGTEKQKAQVEEDLEDSKGWYIRLENPGEKVVSSPVVFAGVVYFTTYTPDPEGTSSDPDDPCASSEARGTARLYAVDYLTGASVHNYGGVSGDEEELGKLDRSKVIGKTIPSAPVTSILNTV